MVKAAALEAGYTIGPVYHGSESPLQGYTFDTEKLSKASGNYGFLGKGFYFTPVLRIAKAYGKHIGAFYLKANMFKIHAPLSAKKAEVLQEATNGGAFESGMSVEDVYNALSFTFAEDVGGFYAEQFSEMMDYTGYNGVWLKSGGKNEMVVYEPNQIKLADKATFTNAGKLIPLSRRFDSRSDDIRF